MSKDIRQSYGIVRHDVDGREYDFFQLKASLQLRVLTLLAKQFGFGLTDFLSSILKKVSDNKDMRSTENLLKEISINESEITSILRNIITNLDDELMIKLVEYLMLSVNHKGETSPVPWEYEFQGRPGALFKTLYFSFMTNFKDFLFKSSDALPSE